MNSRNLKTFQVSLDTIVDLAGSIPNHVLRVAESGIDSGAEIRELMPPAIRHFSSARRSCAPKIRDRNCNSSCRKQDGIHLLPRHLLIGVAQSSKRPKQSPKKRMRTWIKICGTTCVEDALRAMQRARMRWGSSLLPAKGASLRSRHSRSLRMRQAWNGLASS